MSVGLMGSRFVTVRQRRSPSSGVLARVVLSAALSIVCPTSEAQAPSPMAVRPSGSQLSFLIRFAEFARFLPNELAYEGTSPIEEPVIGARRVVLRDGTKLIVGRGDPGESGVSILANELVLEGKAEIIWAPRPLAGEVPPPRAKAANGAPGRGEGADGGPGDNGEAGNVGYAGRNAPPVNLVVGSILGPGSLVVRLQGQDGGEGGRGQDGGDGGPGSKGTPASSSAFDCKRGPGKGGNGGKAGNGGPGGRGGSAGNGSDLTVYGADEAGVGKILAYLNGGLGGKPGFPGSSGIPGLEGPEGDSAQPWCRPAGRAGIRGAVGSPGPTGTPGSNGANGTFSLVPLSVDQVDGLFRDAPWNRGR